MIEKFDYKTLDGYVYHVVMRPTEYLTNWLKTEWEKDLKENSMELWTMDWLKDLSVLDFRLEIVDINKIIPNKQLMSYEKDGYVFRNELDERVEERLESISMGTSIMPLVIRGHDMELMDGYARYESLKQLGVERVYAYVGVDVKSEDYRSHSTQNNYAFIDSQNLHLAIRDLGWELNFERFRVYLKDKYSISKAFLFIGYIEGNSDLYAKLQKSGFVCVFKPTLKYKDGKTKGNCDAELVLWSMAEYQNYDKAVVISGDGDFHCLIKYLIDHNKLSALLIPDKFKYSALLKFKVFRPYLRFMNDLRKKLMLKKEKAP